MRTRDLRTDLLFALCLAFAIAIVYARALDGPFEFDDQTAIVANETLRHLTPLASVLQQPPDLTISGRPIAALSFALNYAAGELDPRGYRAVNAVIHWLVVLLVLGVVRRTLSSPRLAPRFAEHARGAAFATALLFAVHPLASEVVCYASARTESLMALAYLATLYCAIRARDSRRPWGWVAGAIASCALGMGCKEVMASAPLVVALHDAVFWGRAAGTQRRVRVATWTGLALTWGVLAFLVLAAPRAQSAGFEHWVTPLIYLANQCRVIPRYLRLVVAPHPLVFDYGTPDPLALADVWPGLLLLASLFALSLYSLRRWPAAGFVGLACFAILAPSSSVVPIASEVGAERRMYLPLAALLALGVGGSALLAARWRAQRIATLVTAVVALSLAALSFARAGDYRTEIDLWRADVRVRPGNRRAHYNLSKAFERAGRAGEALPEMAEAVRGEAEYYERVLPLQPDPVHARVDLGAVNEIRGDPQRAQALYLEALALAPDDPYALRRMALVLIRRDSADAASVARARQYAERAVAVTSRRDAAALEALAAVQLATGERDAAIETLHAALATDPAQQLPRVLERVREKLQTLEAGAPPP
jgi:tetratricopeptide (TPR) repeat protein